MKKLVNKLISSIKKEEFYLDESISSFDLLSVILERGSMLIRGAFIACFYKKINSISFIGRKVKMKHKSKITMGKSVSVEDYVEIDALSINGVVLGDNVRLGAYTKIKCSGTIKSLGKGVKIGSNSGIGEFSYIGAAGGVEIGENVIMGQNIRFHSENHLFEDTKIPIRSQGVTSKGIKIGDDCWIGAGTTFLDGVNVGNGSVVGANTLVNKDLPSFSIAVGNPVKVIKYRKSDKKNENLTL